MGNQRPWGLGVVAAAVPGLLRGWQRYPWSQRAGGAPQRGGGFLLHRSAEGRGTGGSPLPTGSPGTVAGRFVVLGTSGTGEGFCFIYRCCQLARVAASLGLAPTLSVCLSGAVRSLLRLS